MLASCGHTVCFECLPDCAPRGLPTCPMCRQATPMPENGLPTVFLISGIISSMEEARRALTVSCSGCSKAVLPAEAFACITYSKETARFVCGVCGIKAHRNHELDDFDSMASKDETAAARKQIQEQKASVHADVTRLRRAVADFNATVQRVLQHCEQKKAEITDASLSAPIAKKVQMHASVSKADKAANHLTELLASAHAAFTYNSTRFEALIKPTPGGCAQGPSEQTPSPSSSKKHDANVATAADRAVLSAKRSRTEANRTP